MPEATHLPISQSSSRKLLGMAVVIFVLSVCGCQYLPLGGRGSMVPEPGANKNPCVVLALPDSGPYAPLAAKIKKGAAIAVRDLAATGTNVRLEYLNTEAPDWLARLDALPPVCAVVGGPIQDKAYLAAKKAGALEKRVFFSFVPTLQKGEEGVVAWRFFPSPADQVDALSRFGVNDLNIRTYGSFYPSDSYGAKMTDLLEQSLAKKHVPLRKASYNPAASASWSASAAQLVRPVKSARGQPIPQTDFEALFVPDSWKHMDLIVNSLLYNGEDRLVLMGTTLWESGLSGKPVPKAGKYELAVFPGAWKESSAPAQLRGSGNDFWTALGFDFVNFASYMGLSGRATPVEITTAAQKSAGKIRGMAPIAWDNNGIASQRLYLFQVGSQGMKPLDIDQFRRTRSAVQERAALRLQGLAQETAEEANVVAEEPGTAALVEQAPAQPAGASAVPPAPSRQPVLSPVPQPSYKLRLPAKR